MIKRVSFVGLGVMGYPMAGHLVREGFDVVVYNRTPARAQAWVEQYGGESAQSVADAAHRADCVVTCVGADPDLREIYLGKAGIIAHAPADAVLIDHTTASASVARELSQVAATRHQHFIDAPVSGGQQGAENGKLTIMCGGQEDAFSAAKPVMNSYAKALTWMGESGAGQLTKMANQIAVASIVQGLSESIHFAEQAGLDASRVIEVISKGAAQSWQMENRSTTMIAGEYDHGFAVNWMRKDLAICLQEARQCQASLPITALVDQFYADVQALGGGRWDTSSLLERLRNFRSPKA